MHSFPAHNTAQSNPRHPPRPPSSPPSFNYQHPPPSHAWHPTQAAAVSHDHLDPFSPGTRHWQASSVTPTSRPLLVTSANVLIPTALRATEYPESHMRSHPTVPPVHANIPSSSATTPRDQNHTARDAMMAYAYHIYDSPGPAPTGLTAVPILSPPPDAYSTEHIYRHRLLPLLVALRESYPRHFPILLLLSCTHFALGDFEACLALSHQILQEDGKRVEAMGNIGTTMKAMGNPEKAYEWWWKALQIRPTYWDALDNILNMTFTLAHSNDDSARRLAFYRQALGVCQYVQMHCIGPDNRILVAIPPHELTRLQKVVFSSATIYAALGPTNLDRALVEYARAVEFIIRPPSPYSNLEEYSLRDLVLAVCVVGHRLCTRNAAVPGIAGLAEGGFDLFSADLSVDLLAAVRLSNERLVAAFIQAGDGTLPAPLLTPDQLKHIPSTLFPASKGIFPAICSRDPTHALETPSEKVRQQASALTSTVLLTLAKRFQDKLPEGKELPGSGRGLRVSTSVVILLYYLALALSPSASAYNNLGIVLSTITDSRPGEGSETINGTSLARAYYTAGLRMDPEHPHLLTNLGSLLKDQGETEKAVKLYKKAIVQKPDFEVALANLGNAIKDMGRPWDAIPFYRRALDVNKDLPEAICGLAHSLSSICDWRGRGAMAHDLGVDNLGRVIPPGPAMTPGWITRTAELTEMQFRGAHENGGARSLTASKVDECLRLLAHAKGRELRPEELRIWRSRFARVTHVGDEERRDLRSETDFLLRFIDWVQPRLQRQWYVRAFGVVVRADRVLELADDSLSTSFARPSIPSTLQPPAVPSVLPFHTFTYPLSPRTTRLIPHRSALQISFNLYSQSWLPNHVFRPPRPPGKKLNIGYISNDVNNHPLAHLMQSVFGMHDREQFTVFLYTTSRWDGTHYRPQIASTVEHFHEISSWSTEAVIGHIREHEIQILINLGGYTKGARNEIFAARPCPVQMQVMGYAGTLGAGWCDYLLCDPIACPQEMSATEQWRKLRDDTVSGRVPAVDQSDTLDLDADLDPANGSHDWMFPEKFIYMPHTFMVADHRQSYRGDENLTPDERARTPLDKLWLEEERRRIVARRELFPDLPHDVIIFANFNQLYKIDPGIFFVWLRILERVPRSILWLLRFPSAGEEHLRRTAAQWGGEEIASRVRFTDVANKDRHVFRTRVADLFLDTAECNAHTIAADVLWTGTPVLTWPKHPHKMCSRVATSMVNATGSGDRMTVHSAEEYENRAVVLAQSVRYVPFHEPDASVLPRGQGELFELRRHIFLNRDRMPLFDTRRWVRNFEKGLWEAWRRWVEGTQFEMSDEWEACEGDEKRSGCIWIRDEEPVELLRFE